MPCVSACHRFCLSFATPPSPSSPVLFFPSRSDFPVPSVTFMKPRRPRSPTVHLTRVVRWAGAFSHPLLVSRLFAVTTAPPSSSHTAFCFCTTSTSSLTTSDHLSALCVPVHSSPASVVCFACAFRGPRCDALLSRVTRPGILGSHTHAPRWAFICFVSGFRLVVKVCSACAVSRNSSAPSLLFASCSHNPLASASLPFQVLARPVGLLSRMECQ